MNSAFSLGDNNELSDRKPKTFRKFSILSELSIESNGEYNFPYFNYYNDVKL